MVKRSLKQLEMHAENNTQDSLEKCKGKITPLVRARNLKRFLEVGFIMAARKYH